MKKDGTKILQIFFFNGNFYENKTPAQAFTLTL
jgi:hypothetical protein